MRALMASLLTAVVLAGTSWLPAWAASGRVIASPSLIVRSSASASASVLGTIPYGATITITCTTSGSSMTGPYGATTLWNYITYGSLKGYVTDAYVYTGTSAATAGKCVSAPASTTKAQRVANYAKAQVGATGWNGWCEKWVEQAWGTTGRYGSAIAHYNAVRGQVTKTGTPPAGAGAFYAAAPINGYYGHVMISLGNGQYVTTAPKISIVGQSWPGATYLGWYMPTAWPGR